MIYNNFELMSAAEISTRSLENFYEAAFPLRAEILSRSWRWHYRASSETTPEWPLIAIDKSGRIVGHVSTIPIKLSVSGVEHEAAWFVDFFVLPDMRKSGIGSSLIQAVMRAAPVMLAIGASNDSLPIFRKFEWEDIPGTRKFWIPLRPFDFPRFQRMPGKEFLGALNSVYTTIATLGKRLDQRTGIIMPANETFVEQYFLSSHVKNGCEYAVIRDLNFLRWRIKDCPLEGTFLIHKVENNLALTRLFQSTGVTELNILMLRTEHPSAIFSHLIRWSVREKVSRLTLVTSDCRIKHDARKWFPFSRDFSPLIFTKKREIVPTLRRESQCWELIDSDLDSYNVGTKN